MSAIVTNAKNRIAYTVLRNLGENGIPAYTADFVPLSMSFSSRYSRGNFIYPSPFKDPHGFIQSIIDHVGFLKAKVLLPTFEETFLLSKYLKRIEPHVALAIPDYEQILIAHNKDRWMPIARALGIAVPASFPALELRETRQKILDLRFPVLIKPYQGGGAWGISHINTPGTLNNILSQSNYMGKSWDRFFVQEKIPGQVHCVAMIFNHGQLRGHVVYRQLRDFPFTGGQATLRISIENKAAVKYLRKFLEKLAWHGICQADFVIEANTGIPYLIDVNPRFWGSLIQGIASGVEFPYMLYRIARDGDTPVVRDYKKDVLTRWVWGDLRTFPAAFKNARCKLEFLKTYFDFFGNKAVFDDLFLKDPLPFLTFGLDFLTKMLRQKSLHPVSHDSLDGIWK